MSDSGTDTVQVHDDRFQGVTAEQSVTAVASGLSFTEGPVWSPSAEALYFTDIPNNAIVRWRPDEGARTYIDNSHFAIGLYLTAEEELVSCEHTTRRLVKYRQAGGVQVLAGSYGEHVLNSPNDVVVRNSDGAIYFTDPPFGVRIENGQLHGYQHAMEYGACAIFRVTDDPHNPEVVTTEIYRPNGLCFSRDGTFLYVSDSSEDYHCIYTLPVQSGSVVSEPTHFATVDSGVPDGMRIDEEDRLYVATLEGVQVFAPDATKIGVIPVPEMVTNLCFGGPGKDELFITATTSLYRIRMNTKGVQTP